MIKNSIVKANNTIRVLPGEIEVTQKLPVGNWLLEFNEKNNEYSLIEQHPFVMPQNLYGNIKELSTRYLNTFHKKEGSLGVLLKGLKGSGKSLLAKQICIDSNLPVIIVTDAYAGTAFNSFLSSFNQPLIIFMDEFEKIYPNDNHRTIDLVSQSNLLSLFDGSFTNKLMFLLTANSDDIHDAFFNRPGRIHYKKEYNGLEEDVINTVIDDLLEDKSKKTELIKLTKSLFEINMDQLKTIIWEVNTYKEDPFQAVKYLNIENSSNEVELFISFEFENKIYQTANGIEVDNPYIDPTFYMGFDYEQVFKDKEKAERFNETVNIRQNITITSEDKLEFINNMIVLRKEIDKVPFTFAFRKRQKLNLLV